MRTMMITLLATLAALPAGASVPSMVREAIANGQAGGSVDGPIADEARSKLNATGPLTLLVKRIYLFEQPNCARVQLDFSQEGALLPGSALPAAYTWSTQMNICSDGYPPATLKRRSK